MELIIAKKNLNKLTRKFYINFTDIEGKTL